MLRETIEKCPEETWIGGNYPRNFWRIAYHALFYTHLYAMPGEHDFISWEHHVDCTNLWHDAEKPEVNPCTKELVLEYLSFIDQNIEFWVNRLDLDSDESGFHWYPNLPKLDHQLVNLRHLATHAGQLSELVMHSGEQEIQWVTRVPR